MLIQRRGKRLWLINQHDHALLSGRLAHDWLGVGGQSEPLRHELVLATTLHDDPWRAADATPLYDASNGGVHDFIGYPTEERVKFYSSGLDRLEQVHPFTALLVSKHYTTFSGTVGLEPLQSLEAKRRLRLRAQLGRGDTHSSQLETDLAWLKLFDVLSLFVCLGPPSLRTRELPRWLDPDQIGRSPAGDRFTLEWAGADQVVVKPFPLREELRLKVPVRTLDRSSFPNADSLAAAVDEAERLDWELLIC
jgi:hypothetical protein